MIRHQGIVKEVRSNSILVSIISESACSACHSKGSCLVSDSVEKDIEVLSPSKTYSPGQVVNLVLNESLGFRAVFLGYLLPFIVLMVVLTVSTEITGNDLQGGLFALGSVGIYYITLYFFRRNLKKVFKFELEEIDNS